jgi:uncharacterized protein (DUF433 family)
MTLERSILTRGKIMGPIAIINRGRGPELAGTRITVYDIIPYLEAGHTTTFIALLFRLSSAQVEALIQYINEHREEVMAVNRKIEERIARGNSPEVQALMEESRAKRIARQEELRRLREQREAIADVIVEAPLQKEQHSP